jgi:hypothetical protein
MEYTEKRTEERFQIHQMIGYYPSREEYLWAEGINLSVNGIKCASKAPIDPLTNVFIMLSLPGPEGEKHVRCEGFVAYSRMEEDGRCIFGVHFEHIGAEEKQWLEDYLKGLEAEK